MQAADRRDNAGRRVARRPFVSRPGRCSPRRKCPPPPACRLLLVACCIFLALLPSSHARAAQAQGDSDATVSATLLDPSVDAGETTQYRVTVDNGNADRPPNPPVVDGLTFTYLGPQQQYSFNAVNGRFTRHSTVTYNYSVQTTRSGHFTIPGLDVSVGGATLRTLPVALAVEDAGAPAATPPGQTTTAELLILKKTAYIGESFPAELRTYFGLNVNILAFAEEPILSGEGFSVQKFTPPRQGQTVLEGVRYRAAVYRTAVTGVKTGTLSVGPVDTMPTVQLQTTPGRRRHRGNSNGGIFGDDDDSPFNQFFGGSGLRMQPPQQIKVTAPPVKVEILPLPPGKPDGFSGGIGQFKLEAEAEPRRAQAGDPVTVRLILTGQGNFPRVNAPVLTDDKGLRTYPATAQFKADDDVGLSGTKTFEQVIIADGPRTSLPAYHFDYLDPATGKYVALDTAPIPVQIAGNAVPPPPAVSTAPATAATETPAATPTPTPRAAQDILYIRNDPGRAESRDAFLPIYRTRAFWLAQAVPLAALLLAGAFLVARARARNESARRQAALQRQQGELQRALRRETTSRRDFYTAATRLAQLRAAGGRPDDRLSAAEIVRTRTLDPQTASSVQDIFHRHDELAYSGGKIAEEPVPADERRTVLATLETLGKNGR